MHTPMGRAERKSRLLAFSTLHGIAMSNLEISTSTLASAHSPAGGLEGGSVTDRDVATQSALGTCEPKWRVWGSIWRSGLSRWRRCIRVRGRLTAFLNILNLMVFAPPHLVDNPGGEVTTLTVVVGCRHVTLVLVLSSGWRR